MDASGKIILWKQFGAAIDMLENTLVACPRGLWGDRSRRPEFWYVAYHTLFFLDLYLSGSDEGFSPPPRSRSARWIRRGSSRSGSTRGTSFEAISGTDAGSAGGRSSR